MSNQNDQADRSSGNADGGQPPPENRGGSRGTDQPQQNRGSRTQEQSAVSRMVSGFTETVVRTVVALIGVILLLLGLSQIVGIDLYSVVGTILSSRITQWLLVALFGLWLIVAASKRWRTAQG